MTQLMAFSEPVPQHGGPRPATLVGWGAAASLGLMLTRNSEVYAMAARAGRSAGAGWPPALYLTLLVPLAALLVWRAWPRRATGWLLLAGTLCAVPSTLLTLASMVDSNWLDHADWLVYGWGKVLIGILWECSVVGTLFGLLGAANALWLAGARGPGSALAGLIVAMQLGGPIIYLSLRLSDLGDAKLVLGWSGIGLLVLALAGAVVAVRGTGRLPSIPEVRPGWPLTIGAGIAAASPILMRLWPSGLPQLGDRAPRPGGAYRDTADVLGNHLLYIGLVFLAIGVLVGALAGARVLLAAATAGILLGTTATAVGRLGAGDDLVALTVGLLLVSLAAGFALALSRWRALVGAAGLGLLILGLLLVMNLLLDDDFDYSGPLGYTIDIALVMLGAIACCAIWATSASAVADQGGAPAVLGGTLTPFMLGTICITAHCYLQKPDDGPGEVLGMVLPNIGGFIVVLGLLGALVAAGSRRVRSPYEPSAVDDAGTRARR